MDSDVEMSATTYSTDAEVSNTPPVPASKPAAANDKPEQLFGEEEEEEISELGGESEEENEPLTANETAPMPDRKPSFSSARSIPTSSAGKPTRVKPVPVDMMSKMTRTEFIGKIKALESANKTLADDVESTYSQLNASRVQQSKLTRRHNKVRSNLVTTRDGALSHASSSDKLTRDVKTVNWDLERVNVTLQGRVDELVGELRALQHKLHGVVKNNKETIATERRVAYEQIQKADKKASIACDELDEVRAEAAVRECRFEDDRCSYQNAIEDGNERAATLQVELKRVEEENAFQKGRVEKAMQAVTEVREDNHRRMSLQLDAESKVARMRSEVERITMRLASKEREMGVVVGEYKISIEREVKRAAEVEMELRGTVRDFGVIRDNFTKEVGVLGADRESAMASLGALQDRLVGEEERCKVYQKQLTEARGVMGGNNRALADASGRVVMQSLGELDKERVKGPVHQVAVRELTEASVQETTELAERARMRLREREEVETMRGSVEKAANVEDENMALRKKVEELSLRLDVAAKGEGKSGRAHTSNLSSSTNGSSQGELESGEDSLSGSPSQEEGKSGGGGSGKKKRRIVEEMEGGGKKLIEALPAPTAKLHEKHSHHSHADHTDNSNKIKKLERELDNARKQLVMVESERDEALMNVSEYQDKLHINVQELHRFRSMTSSGEAEINAIKDHRLRSESEMGDEVKRQVALHKAEIEAVRAKHKKEVSFHLEESERHKQDSEKHRKEVEEHKKEVEEHKRERAREKEEYKKAREEILKHKDELEGELATAHENTVAHRNRVMSVDDGLGMRELSEKLFTVKTEKVEFESMVDELTEKGLKSEIHVSELEKKVADLKRTCSHVEEKFKHAAEKVEKKEEEMRLAQQEGEAQKKDAVRKLEKQVEGLERAVGEAKEEGREEIEEVRGKSKREVARLNDKIEEMRRREGEREDVEEVKRELEWCKKDKEGVEKRLREVREKYSAALAAEQVPQQQVPQQQVSQQQAPQGAATARSHVNVVQDGGEMQSEPFVAETIAGLQASMIKSERRGLRLEDECRGAVAREGVAKGHLTETLKRLARVEGKYNEIVRQIKETPGSVTVAVAEIKLLKAKIEGLERERDRLARIVEEGDGRHEREVAALGGRISEQALKIHKMSVEGDRMGSGGEREGVRLSRLSSFGGLGSGGVFANLENVDRGRKEGGGGGRAKKEKEVERKVITLSGLRKSMGGSGGGNVVTPVRMVKTAGGAGGGGVNVHAHVVSSGGDSSGGDISAARSKKLIEDNEMMLDQLTAQLLDR